MTETSALLTPHFRLADCEILFLPFKILSRIVCYSRYRTQQLRFYQDYVFLSIFFEFIVRRLKGVQRKLTSW